MNAADTPRSGGRTTAQLNEAIDLARDGRTVVYAAENRDVAQALMQRCADLLCERRALFNTRAPTLTLDIFECGSIRFVSIGNAAKPITLEEAVPSPRLRMCALLIIDHHAAYLIDRAARDAAKRGAAA